jgi:putative spermidine/putrescine transport system permease protein
MRGRVLPGLLLLPACAVTLVAFLLPMGWLARLSLGRASGGVLLDTVTAENYVRFFTDSFYLGVLWRSVWVASSVAVLAVLAAYPIALFLFRSRSRWRGLLAVLTIAPLLVSSVVRTFGWMIILGDQGWINGALHLAGFITAPVHLMNNVTGVLIGLTEIMMPTTTLALLAGFARLDLTQEEAARTLGASPWRCFCRITLPLTAPGIAVAGLVTFVLSISSFITPSLLGGGRVPMLASTIYEEALETLNWPLAAAISLILIALFGTALLAYERLARRWA